VIAHPVWGSFCSPQIKLTVGGGFERRPNTLSQPNSADRNCQRVEHRRPIGFEATDELPLHRLGAGDIVFAAALAIDETESVLGEG
jgi:hypothetical protein